MQGPRHQSLFTDQGQDSGPLPSPPPKAHPVQQLRTKPPSKSVCPLHPAASPTIREGLFQPHSRASIRFPSSPGHWCWAKLQFPFSSLPHPSSAGSLYICALEASHLTSSSPSGT